MTITKRKPPPKEQNVAAVRKHRRKYKNLKTTHPTIYERKLRLRARSKRNYRHRKAVRDDPKQALVRVKNILKETDEENLNKSMFEEFFSYQCVSVDCQGDVDELKKHYRGHDLGGELNEQLDVIEVDRIVVHSVAFLTWVPLFLPSRMWSKEGECCVREIEENYRVSFERSL